METKVIPTKLDVFNMADKLSFDVDTPRFLKEACENVTGGMYAVCWNIFKNLLAQVAERATELNDPVLNTLMIRLNLYEIPNNERYKVIKQLKEMYDESVKQQQTMKIYIAIEVRTPNELGGVGNLSECEVFKTPEEAIDYVRSESGEEPDTGNQNYVCEATQVTEWDGDFIRFYVIEKEI